MNKNGFKRKFIIKINFINIVFFLLLIFSNKIYTASCTPTMALLCVAPDDHAWVYINGIFIDEFHYVNWDETGVEPKCVTLTSGQLSSLQPTGNIIAVRNLNTNCCEIWSSWSLDVFCAGGGHSFVASGSGSGVSMYHDNSPCPADTPVPSGGYQWYQGQYNQGGSGLNWVAPTIVTGQKWGKRIWDPQTGDLLPALGYSTTSGAGTDDCMQLFFRQPFDLPIEPTPPPPTFTIQKSANPTTNIKGPSEITFTLHICNSGGGTRGNILRVIDTWVPPGGDTWRFAGFIVGGSNVGWNYTDTLFGSITASSGNGPPTTFTFDNGFLSNRCYDLVFVLKSDNPVSQCTTWPNNAALSYLASPSIVSTVTLRNFCPTPTITPLPPVLSLVKSANKTSGIVNGDNISFNMRFCNNGGIINTGTLTLIDDYTSSQDSWQYDDPWYIGNPATGITSISVSNSNKITTYIIAFQTPGFTGCVDIPMNMHMTAPPISCTWSNIARLSSYQGSPTIVSTVNMANVCSTPSFTATRTRTPTPSAVAYCNTDTI